MIRNWLMFGMALALCQGAFADARSGRPVRAAFVAPPRAAVERLGSASGRPVTNGLVFVAGHYQSPPYVVSRHGTVLRVNGHGVTDEVVPWSAFVQALEPAEAADPSSATNATEAAATTSPARAAGAEEGGLNDEAKALLAKIDAERARLESVLANGGYLCVAPGQAAVSGGSNDCRRILMTLPDAMKGNADYSDFAAALRAQGLDGIPERVLRDWHARRRQHPLLEERRWRFRRLERGRPLTVD